MAIASSPLDQVLASLLYVMSCIMNRRNRQAALLLCEFPEVSLDQFSISRVISRKDLALYVIILSLSELNRMEIKDKVLKNPMISQIMESYPGASNIFEDYLNGKYETFQQQMNEIEKHMHFDLNFGKHTGKQIFRDIRMKALRQYVLPYKVVDMNEIAKAFGIPLGQIEKDLATLITQGHIRAKIDSFKKLLHSRKENTQLHMYQNAKELGENYIRDTEQMLLKVHLLKEKVILKPPKGMVGMGM